MNRTLKMVKMAKSVIYILSQLKNSTLKRPRITLKKKKKGTAVKEGGKSQVSYPISHSHPLQPQFFSIFRWYNKRIVHLGRFQICFCLLLDNCLGCQFYSNNQVYSSIPHIVISIIFSFHSLNHIMKFQPLWPQHIMVSNDPLLTAL